VVYGIVFIVSLYCTVNSLLILSIVCLYCHLFVDTAPEYCSFEFKHVKVKVKQSRYMPGVAQRVPGS